MKKEKAKTKPKKSISEVHAASAKRMSRVIGQAEGIRIMLEEGRAASDILAQCKAVRAGLKAIETALMEQRLVNAVENIVADDKKKSREDKIKALMKMIG